jgi:hypothetical protein
MAFKLDIQLDNRTKIIAGVAVLAIAGAGAWFFLFEEEAPPPPKVAAKAPAKPAAAKAPEAKPAAPAKPAAAAKPIPTDPDGVIAEIVEEFRASASGLADGAAGFAVGLAGDLKIGPVDAGAIREISQRAFDPEKLTAEYAANLKSAYDADKMPRYLELRRQPIAVKMAEFGKRRIPPEAMKEHVDNFRKNPPPAARLKLIQDLDEAGRASEIAVQFFTTIAREAIDELVAALQKSGRPVPAEVKQVASQIAAMQGGLRNLSRVALHAMYRDASDEEIAQYLKLMDTETGRWAWLTEGNALRPVLESHGRSFAKEFVALLLKGQAVAKAPAPTPVPKAPAEAAAPAPKPVAPAEYQRPAGIRDLYTRYNDLVTAVVMRDRAAVRELLADGKSPNARQSDGLTALMVAAGNGDAETAELLLARGADPNLRGPGGVSALAMAKESRNAAVVKLLERHGAK